MNEGDSHQSVAALVPDLKNKSIASNRQSEQTEFVNTPYSKCLFNSGLSPIAISQEGAPDDVSESAKREEEMLQESGVLVL